MRGVRFTKAEVEFLNSLAADWTEDDLGAKDWRAWCSIKAKLDKAQEPAGVNVQPIEDALIKAAVGKVVALEGGHARASVQAKNVGATPELAALVGGYMARQSWLHGPLTLIDVLNKWHTWLPKARATEPPPGLEPGLNAETRPSSAPKRPAAAGRRPKAGFR